MLSKGTATLPASSPSLMIGETHQRRRRRHRCYRTHCRLFWARKILAVVCPTSFYHGTLPRISKSF